MQKKVADQFKDKISSATFWRLFDIVLEDKKALQPLAVFVFIFDAKKSPEGCQSHGGFFGSAFWSATFFGR